MFTILGHTLGTPNHDLEGAIGLFAEAELDGIEILWLDDYMSAIPEDATAGEVQKVLRQAKAAGLFVGCLTPYVTGINSTDEEERQHELERFRRAIRTAAQLECTKMRVYGGKLIGDEPADEVERRWTRLVDSLQELGSLAQRSGVVLAVENHFSTMTVSAAQTAALVREVASPAVQALYDQANLAFTHQEDYPEAIALQTGMVGHVHVKDLEFIDPHRRLQTAGVASIAAEDRVHYSRMIGDGILDWSEILRELVRTGYDDTLSLEYEYRWNPQDLPAPEYGFVESGRRLRGIIASLQAPAATV